MNGPPLPPGQRPADGFPRFGAHLAGRAPAVPAEPAIEISGALPEAVVVALADLATLPRREIVADFHCVAGWSATDLRWEGVEFATVFGTVIEPRLRSTTPVTHVVFEGADGYRSILTINDALGRDVLIAERLNGQSLDADHGAPARLVSPGQYGYASTKHLCRIELHSSEPARSYHQSPILGLGLRVLAPHPRARVWLEERRRHGPAWLIRPVYRRLTTPIAYLSARGSSARRRS